MNYKLEVIDEVHTSDLSAACPRAVAHRRSGHITPTYSTAIYRGQLAGVVAGNILMEALWHTDALTDLIQDAHHDVLKMAEIEHRPLSDSVRKNLGDIHSDVRRNLTHFIERMGPLFAHYEVLGIEVPLRALIEMGPGQEPVSLATHIDALFKDDGGQIHLWDFKWVEKSPTMAYLGRNWQFMMMYVCMAYGSLRVHNEYDLWVEGADVGMPTMSWVDLNNFKPYMRKTVVKNETGPDTVYEKGDARPLRNLIRTWTMDPEREDIMIRELQERVAMMRAGFWPRNPDPLGCHLCESAQWCEPYHK